MYLVENGVVGQKWLLGSKQGPCPKKGLHCEARVMVSLRGVGCNLHLTST